MYLCKKSGKLINALARLSNILSVESKKILLNSFIMSNFNYCPLVYHICGKVNTCRMERVLHRGLRIVFNDYVTDIHKLREEAKVSTLFMARLRLLGLYIYKSVYDLSTVNASCRLKNSMYAFRGNRVINQPRFNTKRYGYNSLTYLGPKLWNMLPNECKTLGIDDFKLFISTWDGLRCCD